MSRLTFSSSLDIVADEHEVLARRARSRERTSIRERNNDVFPSEGGRLTQ
jgi:hypothetical protein